MEKLPAPARPMFGVGSSRKDYRDFPPAVQDSFGFELFLAQLGQHPPSAKLLKGLGSGTVELSRISTETPTAPFTPSALVRLSTCCIRSRKNRNAASRHP